MFRRNKTTKVTKRIMSLALVGTLLMSGSAMAATSTASNVTFPRSGATYTKVGPSSTKNGSTSTRFQVTAVSVPISDNNKLHFVLKRGVKPTSTTISTTVKQTALNYPKTLSLTDSAGSDDIYYIHGKTDPSAPKANTIGAFWEY